MIPTTASLEGRIAELERLVFGLRAGNVLEDAALELPTGQVVTTTEMAEAPAVAADAASTAQTAADAAASAVEAAAVAYERAEAAEAAAGSVTGIAAQAQTAADDAAQQAAAALLAAQTADSTGTSAQQQADLAAAAADAAQQAADAAGTAAAQADADAAAAAATAAQAIADAAAAAAAASGAQGTANSALTAANGRNRIFTQATAPSASPFIAGDLWVDTANGRRINIWDPALNGGSGGWAPQLLSTGALSSIVASDVIVQGSITGALVAADAINGKTITGATVQTAASGQRITLDSTNGLRGLDSTGAVKTQLTTAGALTATGATIAGLIRTAASGPRIEMQQSNTIGASGWLRWYTGVVGDNPAGITFSTDYQDDGSGFVRLFGNTMQLIGVAGMSSYAPRLNLNVEEQADSGYRSVARLAADLVEITRGPLLISNTNDVDPASGRISGTGSYQGRAALTIGDPYGLNTQIDNNEGGWFNNGVLVDYFAGREYVADRNNDTGVTNIPWATGTLSSGWTRITCLYRRMAGQFWFIIRATRTSWAAGTQLWSVASGNAPANAFYYKATNGPDVEVQVTSAGAVNCLDAGSNGIAVCGSWPIG